ncbi:MAG: hypothetical protein ACK5IC_09985 [Moheibacter sp.]
MLDDILKQFDPKKATNKQKRNFGEITSQNNMLKNPNLKRIGDNAPGSLDDKIKKGIDGIYENTAYPPPPKYIIDEAKYNTSKLNPKTKDGPQMGDDWIRNRLDQVDPDVADDIMRAMDRGEVDKVLSQIDELGNVTTSRLGSPGNGVIGSWP